VGGGDGATTDGAASDGGSQDGGSQAGETGDHCAEVDAFGPMYGDLIDRWVAEDDGGSPPASPLVFVGSSSIRRWEGLTAAYTDHSPVQRGFGGAQLGEIAQRVDDLVARHDPRAVVVYAGTNDIAAGVSADIVAERWRCFRQRVATALGADRPVLFIGVTPSPARWTQWEQAQALNAAVAADADVDSALAYVDVATPFLATGSPPASSLFVDDGLHLSDSGYALWDSVIRPAVQSATTATATGGGPALPSGSRILVDLGPSNADDGETTPSPDYLGQHWNNWFALEGDEEVLPGEHLDQLVTTEGTSTDVDLVITGGFLANGRSNGGLLWPDEALLGTLAVGSATGDFFYSTDVDRTGGLLLADLDPAARYTLRIFAARESDERRVSTYVVHGTGTASASLQTSGAGAGAGSAPTNDDSVAELTGLQPDAWGHLFVDMQLAEGSYAYVSLVELVVE